MLTSANIKHMDDVFELQTYGSQNTFEYEGGQNIRPMDEFKSLKVVCIVVNAYGHFIPILNCAKALKEKGHDVTILTNGDEGFKKKA